MPKLRVIAQNVCGQASDFALEGFERKADEEEPGFIIYSGEDQFHRVVLIEQESVPPGQCVMKEADVEYDIRELQWAARDDLVGRFLLRELTWGDHNLIREPGLV